MLDEDEFRVIGDLYNQSLDAVQKWREDNGNTSQPPMAEIFQPLREKYQYITGTVDENHVAIMHHRISMYGPECKSCGRPLRTTQASMCAECGKSQE